MTLVFDWTFGLVLEGFFPSKIEVLSWVLGIFCVTYLWESPMDLSVARLQTYPKLLTKSDDAQRRSQKRELEKSPGFLPKESGDSVEKNADLMMMERMKRMKRGIDVYNIYINIDMIYSIYFYIVVIVVYYHVFILTYQTCISV